VNPLVEEEVFQACEKLSLCERVFGEVSYPRGSLVVATDL
jgi:hypothetical protein